jgi:hypothetical protein
LSVVAAGREAQSLAAFHRGRPAGSWGYARPHPSPRSSGQAKRPGQHPLRQSDHHGAMGVEVRLLSRLGAGRVHLGHRSELLGSADRGGMADLPGETHRGGFSDAANDITALPASEHDLPHWRVAIELLILSAEHGEPAADPMFARTCVRGHRQAFLPRN